MATLFLVSSGASADFIFNLPPAIGGGQVVVVKKMDANPFNVNIVPNGTDTIDGVNAQVVITTQYDTVTLCDALAGQWETIY